MTKKTVCRHFMFVSFSKNSPAAPLEDLSFILKCKIVELNKHEDNMLVLRRTKIRRCVLWDSTLFHLREKFHYTQSDDRLNWCAGVRDGGGLRVWVVLMYFEA
uniref:Uncharacterized protein n=1 Tax=Cacopsylla melanoneura TaxID=428564 RepID=A0A8D8Q0N8_9HEMI